MSKNRHIVHLFNTNTMGERKMANPQKEIQTKLTKGLLELIVLQFIDSQPTHGYQIITKIRRTFGVYFGPSTVYPLLTSLEKKGHVTSRWDMKGERPKKIYELTKEGKNLLNFTENSLSILCKIMGRAATIVELPCAKNSRKTSGYQKRMMSTLATPIR